ncbi:hypothetical protein [Klebsiella phage Kpn74]|uniref:Uncharacterized protein n=1 Tax=Klebsiella phage Kpn74 TaxID=3044026 RepID=A0AAT9V563_9CAUD|nr:hypothetical protein [Klebsiella phage Kpn74]
MVVAQTGFAIPAQTKPASQRLPRLSHHNSGMRRHMHKNTQARVVRRLGYSGLRGPATDFAAAG